MAQQAFYTKINAGAGVQFSGGTIAQATGVLHTNNVLYLRGGSSGLFLQNADGSDGIYIANDRVQIETSATQRLRVTSGGDIAIGPDTSPNFKLDIGGDVRIQGTNKLRFGGTGSQDMNFGLTIGAGGGPSAKFMIENPQSSTPYLTISHGSSVNGQVRFDSYGSGSFTGTAAYNLQVDSSGNIIETAAGGSGTVTGNGTATRVAFWSGTSSLSSNANLYWDNTNSRLGLATTSPAYRLDVNGGSIFMDSDWPLYLGSTNSFIEGNSTGTVLRSNASAGFKWTDGGTTQMLLDTDGKLGIGTITPDSKLSVTSTSTASEDILYLKSGIDNADEYLGIAFEVGGGGNGPHGAIRVYNGPSSSDTYMSLLTTTNGGTLTQGLTQNHLGDVGIGTNIPLSLSSNTKSLTINSTRTDLTGALFFRANSSSKAQLYWDSTGLISDIISGSARWVTGSSERMRITSTGEVGIGTSTPGTNLDIRGVGAQSLRVQSDSSATIIIDSDDDDSGTAGSYLHYRDNGATKWSLYKETNNDFYLHNAAASKYPIHAKAGGDIILMEDGNKLGVGASTPSRTLHVGGAGGSSGGIMIAPTSGDAEIQFQDSGVTNAYITLDDGTGDMNFRDDSATVLTVDFSNERVGVLNASPQYALDVAGVIKGTSSIRVDAGSPYFGLYNSGTEKAYLQWSQGSSVLTLQSDGAINYTNNGLQKWTIGGTQLMTLNTDGELGINQANPRAKLEIYNTAVTSDADYSASETPSGQDSIILYSAGTAENTYGSISWVTGGRRRAMITAVAENSDSDYQGIAFYTQGTDGSGDFYESMRIKHSGQISFYDYRGTNNTGTPTYLLGTDANGLMVKTNSGSHLPGGPYLPLAGGSLSGQLTIQDSLSNPNPLLTLYNDTNGGGSTILFSDQTGQSQKGYFTFYHSDGASQGGGATFQFSSTETDMTLQVGASGKASRVVVWSANNQSEVDYGFAGDVNTGMTRIGADQVALIAGGVQGVYATATSVAIKNAGNTKLLTTGGGVDITGGLSVGNINSTGILTIEATYPRINLTDTNHDDDWSIINDDGSFLIYNATDGGQPLKIDSSNNTVISGSISITEQIYHVGDGNTYFGFNANDTWRVVTGGSQRLEINNSGVKIGGGARVTTILDEDDMASDSATALATQQSIKAYVDTSITGSTTFRGTWDPDVSLNSGYGNPNLNTVTKQDGYYYICSANGAATPNGAGTEPNSWHTGDWVVYNSNLTGGAAWQKIDNTSVISGAGTGQKVVKWDGSGTSETIADGPITFSGNNSTFAGNIIISGDKLESAGALTIDTVGQLNLDSGNSEIHLRGSGTAFGKFFVSGSDFYINQPVADEDIKFSGTDDTTSITALTLDMSDAGSAIFNHNIKLPSAGEIDWNTGDVRLIHGSNTLTLVGGVLAITSDGSNAVTFTESGNGLMTIAALDDIVLDAGGDIALDAAGFDIRLRSAGTTFGKFTNQSSNLQIKSVISNKDIVISGVDGGTEITALTLDMSDAGKATFNNGWSSDGAATEYTWRIPNTSSNDGHWYKIARVTSSQSTRFKLQMVGGHSYSDGYYSSEVNAYGQLNNDNNYDLIFHRLEADNQGGNPIISFGQVDVDNSSTDLYVRLNTFAELIITAGISNGDLYPDDTSTGSSTTPTNFVAALEQFGVLSPTIFQSTVRLDSQLLDSVNESGTSGQILSSTGNATTWVNASSVIGGPYLRSDVSDTGTGTITLADSSAADNPLILGSSTQTSYTLQQWQTSAHGTNNAYLIAYGAGHGSQAGNFAMKNTVSSGEIFFELQSVEPLRMTSTGSTFAGTVTADNIVKATNSGSENAMLQASATGTGYAGVYLDASNGDFSGSDYFSIVQKNDLSVEFDVRANAGVTVFKSKGSTNLTMDGANSTFAGSITATTETLTGSTSTLLTLNPTANNYGGILFQYGGSNKGLSVYNSGSMVYGGESGVGTILQVNGQHALNIDTSKNSIFSGNVTLNGDGKLLKFTPTSYDDVELGIDSNGFVIYNTTDARYDLKISGTGNATFGGDLQAPGIYVGATNTSYDFYNNGTSYFNGAVTVDAAFNTSGGAASSFSGDLTVGDELTITTISNATADPDKFLCASSGNKVGYRTGAQVLSDIGAAPATGGAYLPLAGGTMTGDLVMDGKSGFGNVLALASGTLSNTPSLKFYTYNNTDPGGGLGTGTGNIIQSDLGTGGLIIRQTVDNADIIFQSDDGSGGLATYFQVDGTNHRVKFSKNSVHTDNVKALFGDSLDLQIYHDGSNSKILNSTGDLKIGVANTLAIQNNAYDENIAEFIKDGAVNLYHNNVRVFSTGSTGITIQGNSNDITFVNDSSTDHNYLKVFVPDTTVNALGVSQTNVYIPLALEVDGVVTLNNNLQLQDSDSLQLGNSQDLEIYHASGNSNIDNKVGHLYIRANVGSDTGSNIYIQAKSGENSIICNDDGSVNLYYNNSAKLYTHGSGVGAAGYYGFGSAGTSTGSSYYFRYGSSSAGATQGMIISTSDTGGSYFDGVAQFRNTNTGQGANMFQMINYGALYGRYINFYRGSTSNIIGYIGYNSSNTAVTYSTSSSDIRLKKNIVTWDEDVLPKFLALTPKKFDFKAAIGDKGADKVKGFIAQYETENFPEVYQLNGEGQDARYGFHPMEMVPYLMKAVKELAEKNEDLERRLAALEK